MCRRRSKSTSLNDSAGSSRGGINEEDSDNSLDDDIDNLLFAEDSKPIRQFNIEIRTDNQFTTNTN